jgi:heme oxygenase
LLDRLRSETRDAHMALEDALGLMRPPLQRERFVQVLQGFLAFHRAWRPRMAALIDDPTLLAPRAKAALIEQDLQALGAAEGVGRDARLDLGFLTTPSAAWGSLYVLEGSTLGGQVISKALRRTAWAPADGLAYFNPYGRRTGEMWASFRAALQAAAPTLDVDLVAEGARATFQTLQSGVSPAMGAAA